MTSLNITAPVIPGNYADPSVVVVGEDYYMTHSSYKLTPGLIIWHSRDLRNWKRIGAALTEYAGDVWAPDLVHYKDLYYIYYPANRSNWVVTAKDPAGPWSKPINLGIKGIDPGHIATPDGKRYLHMSGGHFCPLSDDGLSVTGEVKHVYDGWKYPDDWIVEAYSLEGPKVTYRDGYYYLTVAVGGTAGPPTSHMVVSSRSRTPEGPWEHSPYNPIVRTASAEEPWWSKGHGSLIETPDGQWWMAYHAYRSGFHTLGRQTLMEPVEWTEDGWYRTTPYHGWSKSPSASIVDDFKKENLNLHWQCEGAAPSVRFTTDERGLIVQGESGDSVSPLLFMAADESYETIVEVTVQGNAEGQLLLFYNQEAYFGIGVNREGVRHFRSFKNYGRVPGEGSSNVHLKVVNDRHIVSFYYSFDGVIWRRYDKTLETSGFHHNTLGGFQSLRIGLDAAGEGEVIFHSFSYRTLEHGL
ncbi:family 43 glycosylhydrolase [Paenibacillus lemnae]|nr:family 43 glycosylhydrolase [Paenibacillus lemnae]